MKCYRHTANFAVILLLFCLPFSALPSETTLESTEIVQSARQILLMRVTTFLDGGSVGYRFSDQNDNHFWIKALNSSQYSFPPRTILISADPFNSKTAHPIESGSEFEKRLVQLLQEASISSRQTAEQNRMLLQLINIITDRQYKLPTVKEVYTKENPFMLSPSK